MQKTFDELTDIVYERHGKPFWGEMRIIYLGVIWKVRGAWVKDKEHHLLLVHDIFTAGVRFPRILPLREVFHDTWFLPEQRVERPTMPPTFFTNEKIPCNELCQVLGGIGVLGSPNVPWPTSSIGCLERGDVVFVIGYEQGRMGKMLHIICRLGVGFIVSDIVGPMPSRQYQNL